MVRFYDEEFSLFAQIPTWSNPLSAVRGCSPYWRPLVFPPPGELPCLFDRDQLFCTGVELGLSSREERRLRVFENRMLRMIFGPKRDEVTGEWRRLHNKELHNLC
jgi:hypothetical protein